MNGSTSSDIVDPDSGLTTSSPVKQTLSLEPDSTSKYETQTTLSVKGSNSTRSKGINFNLAISPVSSSQTPPSLANSHRKTTSFDFRNSHLPQLPEASPNCNTPDSPIPSATEELKYDLPLPLTEHLMGLEIDDQLRLLALKEMSIVEIKDNIGNLNSKLQKHQMELHSLREVIQKSLYKELSSSSVKLKKEPHNNLGVTGPQRHNSNPREEAIASTKNRTRRRTLSSSSSNTPHDLLFQQLPPSTDNPSRRNSTLWSNLSKPLNLIQQFDTMLLNEFEKSMIPKQNQELTSQHSYKSRRSEDSISSVGSISSPLNSKSKPASENRSNFELDQYFSQKPESSASKNKLDQLNSTNNHVHSEDMLQAVSSSIWSFVNDVKSNVISSLGEDDVSESRNSYLAKGPLSSNNNNDQKEINDLTMYNLDTGSTVSLNDNKDSVDLDNTIVRNSSNEEWTTANHKTGKTD